MEAQVSGIVLAGGVSRRLGRDKSMEMLGDRPLISRVIGRLSGVAEETVVVVNDERRRESLLPLIDAAESVVDAYPGKGPLEGIFTGLSAISAEWGIVVGCDMPFLNESLLREMLSLREGSDAVVPMVNGLPDPTHALYSKSCLPHIRRRLEGGDLKVTRFYDDVRVRFVSEHEVDRLDPDHYSFFNVNAEADLERALVLLSSGH
jgi:molybdopterin-guanine dinucleotide biosynthesis protein A